MEQSKEYQVLLNTRKVILDKLQWESAVSAKDVCEYNIALATFKAGVPVLTNEYCRFCGVQNVHQQDLKGAKKLTCASCKKSTFYF